ncbi:hypothetical protein [Levilactobacillus brevis]|uniref:hypothetical protein n=1 Tax=Levilactobacillus brevis TaxID=1580 RepID=UPI00374F41ED
MQMISVSKKKSSKGMLSSLGKSMNPKHTMQFEKETVTRVLNDKNIQKTMELLSKV